MKDVNLIWFIYHWTSWWSQSSLLLIFFITDGT